jgi:hypothetical protein
MKTLKEAILLIAIIFLLCGCASRKKDVHKTETVEKFRLSVDTSYSFRKNFMFQNALSSYTDSKFQSLVIDYEGKPGDSISVEQYGPDGQLLQKTKIKGTGKTNLRQTSGASREETTTKESGQSEEEGKASGHKDAKGENSTAALDEEISTSYFPWWLWLVLIAIALAAGYKLWRRFHVTRLFKNK